MTDPALLKQFNLEKEELFQRGRNEQMSEDEFKLVHEAFYKNWLPRLGMSAKLYDIV